MANQNKFPTSLVAGVVIALAVAAYMVLPTLGSGPEVDMSETAVLERIKPIGSVTTTAAPASEEPAAKPEAPADTAAGTGQAAEGESKPASASTRSGEDVFNTACTACHSTGAAGAPKLGDKEAWAPRIATGVDAMLEVAIKGKNAMPPRGTCSDCSDEELRGAIEYIVSKSQ